MLAWQYVTYDYGLVVPESTLFGNFSPELKSFLEPFEPEWATFPALGTKPYNGMAILNVRMKAKFSKAEMDDMIAQFSLNWRVGGIRSAYPILDGEYDYPVQIDKALYLNYADDIIEYTDIDTFTTRRPTMEDEIIVSMFAGTDPVIL